MQIRLLKPRHYFNEFKELIKFSIAPNHNNRSPLTRVEKIRGTWTMFVVKFILAAIVGVAVALLYDPDNKTTVSMAERFSLPMLFLVTVIILPLLEEVAFRLSLKFKPIYLTLTLGTLGYYTSSKAIYFSKLSDVQDFFIERVVITFTIMIVAYPILSYSKVKVKLEQFWQQNFRWIFYFLSIGFAWVHIFNYELTVEHLLLMPVITLPKLVSALCYQYTRMTYGFVFSLAIHMLNNIIGFIANVL